MVLPTGDSKCLPDKEVVFIIKTIDMGGGQNTSNFVRMSAVFGYCLKWSPGEEVFEV